MAFRSIIDIVFVIIRTLKLVFGVFLVLTVQPTTSSSSNSINLEWYAPFYSGGGYCSEAYAFMASILLIRDKSISVTARHHGDSYDQQFLSGLSPEERSILSKTKYRSGNKIVSVCHSEPGAWHAPYPKYQTYQCPPPDTTYNIGRTMFETDTIPEGWISRLNYMDEVWVPTHFARNIFESAGVRSNKLRVIGEPIDTDFYSQSQADSVNVETIDNTEFRQLIELSKTHFVFLFVGKWEERKGVRGLVTAYFREFTGNEKVVLAVLTSAYHSTSDFHGEILRIISSENLQSDAQNSPKWILLNNIPQSAMPKLYASSNVLVIPSHGEGWGRPHVEAMSVGVPVIATNWSGPTEFITAENGYPLNVRAMIPANGWRGHFWADPSLEHLQELMRTAMANPEEASAKGRQARKDMESKYSLRVMANVMHEELKRIAKVAATREVPDEL